MENAFGLTRAELEKHKVILRINVDFKWADDTPEELRKTLAEASHVLHHLAETQIMLQLQFEGLAPNQSRDVLYGEGKDGTVCLSDSGWR